MSRLLKSALPTLKILVEGKFCTNRATLTVQGASGMSNKMENGNELEVFAEKNILRGRIKSLQSKAVDMEMNLDKSNLCQRFVFCKKSLECARAGKFSCKNHELSIIYDDARVVGSGKHSGKTVDESSPYGFCSHFFTNPHLYLMYPRVFTFECDIGEGKFVSICLAVNQGNFDNTLPWPIQSTIEVTCINQDEPVDK